ncbi:MAG: hypothetical protein DRR00_27265 [Candidatus Parabeggiatoa sp. nov. 3]|nr:MAG: hypothetical protein DRR00_27265 [Gammaproteobacteria bacterium]RKZ52235.1 MAG: hypothetical protein DRQ99_32615 [Gammaproteobacteria bacterium]
MLPKAKSKLSGDNGGQLRCFFDLYFSGCFDLFYSTPGSTWGYSHSTPSGLFNPIFKAFDKHKIYPLAYFFHADFVFVKGL